MVFFLQSVTEELGLSNGLDILQRPVPSVLEAPHSKVRSLLFFVPFEGMVYDSSVAETGLWLLRRLASLHIVY